MRYTIDNKPTVINKVLSAISVVIILIGFVWLSVDSAGLELDFTTLFQYRQRLGQGFLMTIAISIGSLIISPFIGSLTAIFQNC